MASSKSCTPDARFWQALVAALRARGRRQQELAAQLRLTAPTLSRRLRGDGHLLTWPELDGAIAAFGLDADQRVLRRLLQAAIDSRDGAQPGHDPRTHRVQEAFSLQIGERDQEAVPILEEICRALRPAALQGKGLDLFTEACLKLSAGYGNLGRMREALQLARHCVPNAAATRNAFLCFQARHQVALMVRLCGPDRGSAAYRLFAGLVRDYEAGIRAGTAAPDAVARALRDGARALVGDPSRWEEAAEMQAEALRWASRSCLNTHQQQFHTALDQAALALARGRDSAAEGDLGKADRILLRAYQEGEVWMTHRAQAKYGLVHTAFAYQTGEPDRALALARCWSRREEPLGNRDACATAAAIIAAIESEQPGPIPVSALLR